jgi:phage terminase small subunit
MVKKTTTPAKLNPRMHCFVKEYLISQNATAAAIAAGYSSKGASVQGARLLANAKIRELIQQGRDLIANKLEVTAERIVQELAKIGFANMADYMTVGTDGYPALDWSKLTRDQAAALSSVTVDDFVEGRGEDARAGKRVRFKLHDKRAALVDLGKNLGMFQNDTPAAYGFVINLHLGDDALPTQPPRETPPLRVEREEP